MIEWVLGLISLSLFIYLFFQKKQERQLMRRLEKMLDQAKRNEFQIESYNESLESKFEFQLGDYLKTQALQRNQVQSEQAQIKQLISDISHQTKTPIANLKLYIDLMSEHADDEVSQTYLRALADQNDKLNLLIQSLVKLSRLESGVIQLHPRQQSVETLLNQVARQYQLRGQQADKNIRVESTQAQACYDLAWTQEALGNLVDNAIKYSIGKSIELTCKESELFVRIGVTDHGPGIEESQQASIFQRFYRGSNLQQHEGLGIGLSLSRQIIQKEAGFMEVESQIGRGTSFYIFLPKES